MQELSDNSANKRTFTHYPAETRELLLRLETLDHSEDALTLVATIERLLKIMPRENDPSLWSELQMRLGSAYEAEAGAGNQRTMLRRAIVCYDAALTIYNPGTTPDGWARAQLKKGDVLREFAELEGRARQARMLRTAVACYDAALTFYTREASPLDWARTQDSKGVALCQLAEFLAGAQHTKLLGEAVLCYNAALLEYRRDVAPVNWATVQNNKGNALNDLAGLLIGAERAETLREAIACYDCALQERRREQMPDDWAMTQNNKGNALRNLAEVLSGAESEKTLRKAVACYDAALTVYTVVGAPDDWAMAQNSKGIALCRLAESLERAERARVLQDAVACYDAALFVYTRQAPLNWAAVQGNKGNALGALAQVLDGSPRVAALQTAIVCHDAALTIYTQESAPIDWAMEQTNKGNLLRDLADLLREGKGETLYTAVACYDAALSVYSREVLPADHHRVAQAAGRLLLEEGDWGGAARYLATALDALDDLFALEVTALGRQDTLKVGGDLTARLAYALVRAGGAEAARQAAEALERGRARATGEAVARQEAQLAAAERLAPDVLEAFREASDRLAAIALTGETARAFPPLSTMTEAVPTAGSGEETPAALERLGGRFLTMRLAGYEEAREARRVYDAAVERVREVLHDFLEPDRALEVAGKALAPDERLVYLASAPGGAAALLVGGPRDNTGIPFIESLWDEQLTSAAAARLLTGSPGGGAKQQGLGLLAAQSYSGKLGRAVRVTIQTLGAPGGVLDRLARYCRASGARRLWLVPCGLLGLLPLHAALIPTATQEGEVEPLLDVVQVSYALSARIWAACRRRAVSYARESPHALLGGDPQPPLPGVDSLAGAKDELERICKIVAQEAHGQVASYCGDAATHTDVLSALITRSAIVTHVHFACHAVADLTNPHVSGLLLAYGARLMTRNLLDPAVLHFERLRLAVLSACRTALPGTELPDEVAGLPAGWLQAGAIGVLASVWPVSDSRTISLMTKFYELHLLDRLDPVLALWLAQRWLRGLPTWRKDCRAMGALQAADGPEAGDVVNRLALARGEPALPDDPEERGEGIGTPERKVDSRAGDDSSPGVEPDPALSTIADKQRPWRDARHWAAFVVYGE